MLVELTGALLDCHTEVRCLFLLHRQSLTSKQWFQWIPCLHPKMHGSLFARGYQILSSGSIEEWTPFPGQEKHLSNEASIGS